MDPLQGDGATSASRQRVGGGWRAFSSPGGEMSCQASVKKIIRDDTPTLLWVTQASHSWRRSSGCKKKKCRGEVAHYPMILFESLLRVAVNY